MPPSSLGSSPCPAMWTMRHGRSNKASITVRASGPGLRRSSLISALTRSARARSAPIRHVRTACASIPRAEQPRVARRAFGLADDQHARARIGVAHVVAELLGAQLAQQLGADRPRPPVGDRARRGRCRAAPTGCPRSRARARSASRRCRRETASISTGIEQLEQRPADLPSLVCGVRRVGDQVAQQLALRALRAHLAAGALGVERVLDLGLAVLAALGLRR